MLRIIDKTNIMHDSFVANLKAKREILAQFPKDPEYSYEEYRNVTAGRDDKRAEYLSKIRPWGTSTAEEAMYNDAEALARETRRAYRDGFSAKAAIHPGQVPVINQAMTPDAATQEWAKKVVAAFASSGKVGVATLDGKMLDMPHLRLAKKIIAAAQLA